MDSKKKRESNYSAKEERLLVSIVKKFSHIIENKKTDSEMNRRKNVVWQQLTKEFNSICGETFRSVDSLKSKYLNIKKNAKKKFAEEKKQSYVTGGGPPVTFIDSPVESEIRELIGSQMTGFTSNFDNDGSSESEGNNIMFIVEDESNNGLITDFDMEEDSEETTKKTQFEEYFPKNEKKEEEINKIDVGSAVGPRYDWKKQSVEALRTPVSKKLQIETGAARKRDNCLKTKLTEWAKSKHDTLNVQQECMLDEHKQKLAHAEEKHKEEIKQMQENHQLEKERKKEEHLLKMSILKIEKEKLIKELHQ